MLITAYPPLGRTPGGGLHTGEPAEGVVLAWSRVTPLPLSAAFVAAAGSALVGLIGLIGLLIIPTECGPPI
jgi:hypothetical protein